MPHTVYLNKKDEVFERRVEVGLLLQLHHRVKVLVVDVSVHPEQTLQNGLCHRHKVTLKGDTLGGARQKQHDKVSGHNQHMKPCKQAAISQN